MLSWFSALTITPVLIKWWLFKRDAAPPEADETDPYDKRIYRIYQAVLNALLRRKAPTLVVMTALLAAAIWGFGSVRQNFFPSSSTPIFFVDLWLPYGTDIKWTEKMTGDIEKTINSQRRGNHGLDDWSGKYAIYFDLQRTAAVQQLCANHGENGRPA